MADYERFALGDLELERGGILPRASLAYAAYGTLSPQRDNVIVVPSAYGGTHADSAWLIGPGKALDTERWFVVATNLFGNGLSTSPSNMPGADVFPLVTIGDNVRAQECLIRERFAATHVALVTGFSMGALQAYHWACLFGERVARIVPMCGSARTSAHNRVFLDGAIATLEHAGPAVLGKVWAAWGLSQAFYRNERWRAISAATTLEAFVDEWYGPSSFAGDPRDLRAMFDTWRAADVARLTGFDGSFARALASISARAIVMPSRTDTYFPPEDSAIEVEHLRHGELRVIESEWGHAAGAGVNPADSAFISTAISEILAQPSTAAVR